MMDVPRRIACGWLLAAACSLPAANSADGERAPVARVSVDNPQNAPLIEPPGELLRRPGLGAHAVNFYRYRVDSPPSIDTSPMATQPSGSLLVVGVGRGDASLFALPTDSNGHTARQLGSIHSYTLWPDSGTAMYSFLSPGGPDLTISNTTTPDDEITLAAVEVLRGTKIQAVAWNEVTSGPLTSRTVTTTGPATLIAFWWGDAFPMEDQTATPDSGFTVVDAVLFAGSLVQCAVAVKNVTTAGTYRVTWTATPEQGAQLWLVAVQ
jgi:hypothetical protein